MYEKCVFQTERVYKRDREPIKEIVCKRDRVRKSVCPIREFERKSLKKRMLKKKFVLG